MLKIFQTISRAHNKRTLFISVLTINRNFLSNSYELDSEYNDRLNNKLIQKINPSNMYLELDQQYNKHKKMHAIDVDLYVNSLTSEVHTEELEDIMYKFRLTPSTVNILPSTPHSFIRFYLNNNKIDQLLEILDDRLNYGIFPDDYCTNLLLNKMMEKNDYRNASKIACLQMLQEDFSNEITKHLSLLSCYKYLQKPSSWIDEETKEDTNAESQQNDNDDDEEEETKIRVKYLRNPYFDNHFDLKKPQDLIGKTFLTIARIHKNDNDTLFNSYHLLGLGLMKNIESSKSFLEDIDNGKVQVSKESLELFKKYLIIDDLSELSAESVGKELSSDNKETNLESKETAAVSPIGEDVKNLLGQVDKLLKTGVDLNILEVTEVNVKKVVEKFEKDEIEKQKELYMRWDSNREATLKKHVKDLKQAEIFDLIEKTKQQLAKEEERIFFFDNENQIDLKLEEKYPKPPVVVVKKRNEFDGMRNKGRTDIRRAKKQTVDENYVPPDLHKPYRN